MAGYLPLPHFLPCPECGEAIASDELDDHECDAELRLEHQLSRLRHLVDRFEWELRVWLGTPEGRFAQYWAEYDRSRETAA